MKTISVQCLAIVVAAYAAAVVAAPAPDPRLVRSYTATFEDAGSGGAIMAPTLPGPYDALNWQGIFVPGYCGRTCPVNPYSFPVDVEFNDTSPAQMLASYGGSKVAFFDLQSFATGCAAKQGFNATFPDGSTNTFYVIAPVNCTVAVRGWRGPAVGAPAASTTITYKPVVTPNSLGAPAASMSLFPVPPSFIGLRTVTYTPAVAKDAPETYGNFYALLDSVSYRVTNFTL